RNLAYVGCERGICYRARFLRFTSSSLAPRRSRRRLRATNRECQSSAEAWRGAGGTACDSPCAPAHLVCQYWSLSACARWHSRISIVVFGVVEFARSRSASATAVRRAQGLARPWTRADPARAGVSTDGSRWLVTGELRT